MKKYVITYNVVEGFHHYPNAPKTCQYLANEHRHLFHIRCWFEVEHNNRQVEINTRQNEIEVWLKYKYGTPCQFHESSCEDIAQDILVNFNAFKVQVLEDNYGGAEITK